MRKLLILIALVAASAACDKDAGSSGETAETTEQAAESAETDDQDWEVDGYSVGKLKIIAASKVYSTPDATKPDELEKKLEKALESTESYESGAAPLYGSITYDARTVTTPEGEKIRDVVLFGDLRRKGDDDPTSKYTAEIMVRGQPNGDETYAMLADDAVQQFAERIDAEIRIKGASSGALLAILKSKDESERAKIEAIQQIRERQIDGTEEVLRGILAAKGGESDSLRVSSAAALVALGDSDSRANILELAQTYSRDKNPNFLPMIYILADMGGEEVVTYLTTVSEAHSSPAVRQVAKEAVDKAIESTAVKAPK